MTYCLAINLEAGIVFASDFRTNAGVDQVSTYSKMHGFCVPQRRVLLLLTAGNLATTQAVVNSVRRDIGDPAATTSLNTVEYMFDAARYIGKISRQVQARHTDQNNESGPSLEATFILGGQLRNQPQEIYLIYPEGNYITASPAKPYLQIGETKYGKPILDRMVSPGTSLEDAARCALVSLDSTSRSNVSVGPPFELSLYDKDQLELNRHLVLTEDSPFYISLRDKWVEAVKHGFEELPRFSWEDGSDTLV